MKGSILLLAIMAFLMLGSPAQAQAQAPVCTDRNTVIDHLHKEYKEFQRGMGIANNGGVIELFFADDSTRTWTIIITMPSGVTCMIAAGESWENLKKRDIIKKDDGV